MSVANSRKPRGVPNIEDLISAPTIPETALSILCAGAWDLDSDKDMQMIFYRNGVGEVRFSNDSMPFQIHAAEIITNRYFCVVYSKHVHILLP